MTAGAGLKNNCRQGKQSAVRKEGKNLPEPLYQPSHMLGYGNIYGGKFNDRSNPVNRLEKRVRKR